MSAGARAPGALRRSTAEILLERPLITLSGNLIPPQFLPRGDGKLPQYTLGGNVVPFVPLPRDGARR